MNRATVGGGQVPSELIVGGRQYLVERATRADVPAIVALLRDDPMGAAAPGDDLAPYLAAFDQIAASAAHLLVVVRDDVGGAAATVQLVLLPGLSRGAITRLQIEAVRVAPPLRGSGLGSALLEWVHGVGRSRGAAVAQLTTDRRRTAAHRFYERLGYRPSHLGMKRPLN